MADNVTFQSGTPATPPANTVVATDDVSGVEFQKVKLDLGGDGVSSPLVGGQQLAAASVPVTLTALEEGLLGSLTETAPTTDTASSGLNGRLQRIAQRLSSIIALLPTALGAGGGIKVDGSGTALPVSGTVTANAGTNLNTSSLALDASVGTTNTQVGGLTETAPSTDTASSGLNGRLQRIAQRLTSIIALLPTALGSGGGLKVDGSGTALPVSGTVALSTAVALDATLATTNTEVGGLTETAPGTDTASSGLNGRLQRIAQRLTSLIALLPSALVGGKFSVTTATTLTPSWTKGTAVIAIQMLAKGAVLNGTIDLTGKPGARLIIFIMKSGTTALDVSIKVNVRIKRGSSAPYMWSAPIFSAASEITAAVQGVAAGSGNNAGVASLTLNAAKTFVANSSGLIYIGVIDNTTTPTTASEILRQSVATSTTVKLLEWPTESAHNSTSHVVADQASLWEVRLEGGELYNVSIDYGAATTGDSVAVGAYASSYDSDGGT